MNYVVKRDGRLCPFNSKAIETAISMALNSTNNKGMTEMQIISTVMPLILQELSIKHPHSVSVEDVQDIVISNLIVLDFKQLAKDFSSYRDNRSYVREKKTVLMNRISKIANDDAIHNDLKRENANIDGDTAMGTMLKFGSTTSKEFYLSNVLNPEHAKAHLDGDIHIHDLDFYGLTTTCCQIDLSKLFSNGFSTGHGHLRPPANILTASALACIAIQSNQNDQHGGQSVPKFDYDLAPYVSKSFIQWVIKYIDIHYESLESTQLIKKELTDYSLTNFSIMSEAGLDFTKSVISKHLFFTDISADDCIKTSLKYTDKETYQAMEALIHNLCTMNSRAGAQVPFSSINFGTDTSEEGRLVIKNLLLAQEAGLGGGETAIFPITIFKVKEGVNFNPNDINYDLFKLACRVSAKRLFPNFAFIDAPYNLQYYNVTNPNTEIAYMGCVRGDETVTISIEGKVYRNIPIQEAYMIIQDYTTKERSSM